MKAQAHLAWAFVFVFWNRLTRCFQATNIRLHFKPPGYDALSKAGIHTAIEIQGHSAAPPRGSDRSFGYVFGALFAIIGAYPLVKGLPPQLWSLLLGALFTVLAALRPSLLAPLNWLWTKLGLALNRVVSPIALLLVYCLAIVPMGLALRALGKDPLRLRLDREASTYWITRMPPGRADEQMKRQF